MLRLTPGQDSVPELPNAPDQRIPWPSWGRAASDILFQEPLQSGWLSPKVFLQRGKCCASASPTQIKARSRIQASLHFRNELNSRDQGCRYEARKSHNSVPVNSFTPLSLKQTDGRPAGPYYKTQSTPVPHVFPLNYFSKSSPNLHSHSHCLEMSVITVIAPTDGWVLLWPAFLPLQKLSSFLFFITSKITIKLQYVDSLVLVKNNRSVE